MLQNKLLKKIEKKTGIRNYCKRKGNLNYNLKLYYVIHEHTQHNVLNTDQHKCELGLSCMTTMVLEFCLCRSLSRTCFLIVFSSISTSSMPLPSTFDDFVPSELKDECTLTIFNFNLLNIILFEGT